MMKFAEIIVDVVNSQVDRVFDYIIPEDFLVNNGDMVVVPFGSRYIEGYVLAIKDTSSYSIDKLKPIKEVVLQQVIKPEILYLIYEMKSKFYLKYIDLIKLVVPSEIRNGQIKTQYSKILRLNND